jgi:DNA-binding SARP family transcriptional activator
VADAGSRSHLFGGFPVIFGGGLIAGILVVAATRTWLRLRSAGERPDRPAPPPESAAADVPALISRPGPAAAEVEAAALRPVSAVPEPAAAALRPVPEIAEPQTAALRPVPEIAEPQTAALRPVPAATTTPPLQPGVVSVRPSLRIGVLGQLTINGQPGALLPAQTQLILALALHRETGLPNRRLCQLLGADAEHRKPADSLRQLIARTRRQLGPAADGGEWIEHRGHGCYALHADSRLDWDEFQTLTAEGIRTGDAAQLATALAMIRGQPFTGCYYWWLDFELVDMVSASIVTAAVTLAALSLSDREPAAAARAARIGLVADSGSEELWRMLMRAEHAAGNLAGVREAWSRCGDAVAEISATGEPEDETAELYRQLLDRSPAIPSP